MSFSDSEINLSRYKCAQCNRTPTNAQELFQGCICGHRLFRIIRQNNSSLSSTNTKERKSPVVRKEDLNFLTVHELEVGIYDINVEKLLAGKSDKIRSSPVVVGNEGVFSIRFQHQKK
ncbi:MAG: hypothetical protein JSU57_05560 [Candidatus Heimdallarchaeota archaeon]|nr:MAG: hypothetical protein JSU57_05560 [Candidatus Heimdallarchaeota archaeon]